MPPAPEVWACQLQDVLPLVEAKARRLLADTDGGLEKVVEDCRAKLAFCFRSQTAFAVLSLAPATSGWVLFVRLAMSLSGTTAMHDHMPFIEQVARDLGAKSIRFRTTRHGWSRLLDHSWRVSHVEYEREVA